MIREYVGTVNGKTLDVYRKKDIRDGHILKKRFSNGFYVAEINDGMFNTIYFSRIEGEIDDFIEDKKKEGFKHVQM